MTRLIRQSSPFGDLGFAFPDECSDVVCIAFDELLAEQLAEIVYRVGVGRRFSRQPRPVEIRDELDTLGGWAVVSRWTLDAPLRVAMKNAVFNRASRFRRDQVHRARTPMRFRRGGFR